MLLIITKTTTSRLTREKFIQALERLRQLQDKDIDFYSLEREKNEAVRAAKYFYGYQNEN